MMFAWFTLAIRAIRGFRTYAPCVDCNCSECLSPNRPGLVPIRSNLWGWWRLVPPRLNQPPFRWDEEDAKLRSKLGLAGFERYVRSDHFAPRSDFRVIPTMSGTPEDFPEGIKLQYMNGEEV